MAQERKVKKTVRIREAKEALKQEKEANKGRQGKAVAQLRNVPTSPRKMRLVAEMIKGQSIEKALGILKFEPKVGAQYMEKALLSAISNWENKNEDIDLDEAELYVSKVFVDSGRVLKRLRPAPQGRAHRIRKRSNHITLEVDSKANVNTLFAESLEQIENVISDNESNEQ